MKKFILVYSVPVLVEPIFIALLTNWPTGASMRGVIAIVADWIGNGLAIALIGSIGLLYRPNRFAGLIFGIALVSLLWLAGITESNAKAPSLLNDSKRFSGITVNIAN